MTRATTETQLPSRIAAAVRGSEALRQDITDEIADHLACHADEAGPIDAASAETEAIHAFGDPNEVVRELRRVHMGDWIMFQKLMVLAMVVIVVGMAASSYFSWSANREMARELAQSNRQMGEQMAEANRQSSEQIAVLTKQFASLSKMQALNRPPTMQITCYTLPGKRPAGGYEVRVESIDATTNARGKVYANTFTTDQQGRIETGPLPQAVYVLDGSLRNGKERDGVIAATGNWTRVVRLQRFGQDEALDVCVGSAVEHTLTVEPPEGITWDREAMRVVGVSVLFVSSAWVSNQPSARWSVAQFPASLTQSTRVVGLLPGPCKAVVSPPSIYSTSAQPKLASARYPHPQSYGHLDGEMTVPTEPGEVTIRMLRRERHLQGIVFEGSKDKCVAGVRIDVVRLKSYDPVTLKYAAVMQHSSSEEDGGVERLITDDQGRFGAISPGHGCTIVLHGETNDGRPAMLIEAVANDLRRGVPRLAIDVSKLATLRIDVVGRQTVQAMGYEVESCLGVDWRRATGRNSEALAVWPFASDGMFYLDASGDDASITRLLRSGTYHLLPVAAAWRPEVAWSQSASRRRPTLLAGKSGIRTVIERGLKAMQQMSLDGGKAYTVRFDLATLYEPIEPQATPPSTSSAIPLTLGAVRLCRNVEGLGKYDEIDPPVLPAGIQTQTVLYCEYKNPAWVRKGNKRYNACLSLSVRVVNGNGEAVLRAGNDDMRVESQRKVGYLFLQQPITFPATLPEGTYSIHVTLKDKDRGTVVSKTLPGLRLKPNP